MKRTIPLFLLALAALPGGADAQGHGAHSPYSEEHSREIKALSAAEVRQYLEGRGMGFALPAELNRHPGPLHVLELEHELGLTWEQSSRIREIRTTMNERAVAIGSEYVEREREMDRLFAARTMEEARLGQLTAEIGRLLGELRYIHLRAHLETTALLTPEQVRRYHEARGYGRGRGNGE